MKATASFLVLCCFASAMFIHGEKVPLERLMSNVKAHFAAYENQAEANYLLGRLESLAFSGEADTVEVLGSSDIQKLPYVASWSWVQENTKAPAARVPSLRGPASCFSPASGIIDRQSRSIRITRSTISVWAGWRSRGNDSAHGLALRLPQARGGCWPFTNTRKQAGSLLSRLVTWTRVLFWLHNRDRH